MHHVTGLKALEVLCASHWEVKPRYRTLVHDLPSSKRVIVNRAHA